MFGQNRLRENGWFVAYVVDAHELLDRPSVQLDRRPLDAVYQTGLVCSIRPLRSGSRVRVSPLIWHPQLCISSAGEA